MNHPSECLPHRAFKRYCGSKKIVEEEVINNLQDENRANQEM